MEKIVEHGNRSAAPDPTPGSARRAFLGLACWQPNVVYFMVAGNFDEPLTRWFLSIVNAVSRTWL